jgi:hypothetical protein
MDDGGDIGMPSTFEGIAVRLAGKKQEHVGVRE